MVSTTWQFTPGDDLEGYSDLHGDGMGEKRRSTARPSRTQPRTSALRSAHSGRISTNCLEETCQALGKKVAAIMMVECSDLGREISEDLCDAMEAISHEVNKAPLRFMGEVCCSPGFCFGESVENWPRYAVASL